MNTVDNSFSDEMSSPDRMKKYLEARTEQLAKEDICLAFSGGVDSSLLLKTAADAAAHTGRKVYAATFDSYLYPFCDLEIARRVAGELGGIHEVITADELEQESMKNNPVNRCCLCKCRLFSRLAELTEVRGVRHIPDSTNRDDVRVYRPGIRMLKGLGIISPLVELHITKAQVKALTSEYGIPVASHSSTPCMTTRLSYGAALDCEVLRRIGEGETYVRIMALGNVCLRLHGDIVCLELDPKIFEVFMKGWKEIVSRLKKMGFVYVTLDAEGFHSGNVDIGLSGPEAQ